MGRLSTWFRGIKGKLLLASAVSLTGFIIVGFITSNGTKQILHYLDSAHKEIIPNLKDLATMRISRNAYAYNAYATLMAVEDGKPADKYLEKMKEAANNYKLALDSYTKSPFTPEEEKRFGEIESTFTQFVVSLEKNRDILEKKDVNLNKEVEAFMVTDFEKLSGIVSKYTSETMDSYNTRAQAESDQANQTAASVERMLFIVMLLAGGFSFLALIWIAAQVSKSVSGIAERLSNSSATVASSVEQLNEAGNSLSQSSTEAAASLEETVASLEELSSMVQMNSDNAKQAAALSLSSREAAEKGQSEIQSLITAMSTISKSSKKIEEIISVIDDIAFQTNLLALNASVEAARAGEQGKGFAVVAEAVRALAQRSAAAAKDINALIKESVSEVDQGSRIASHSGEVLNNIVNSVKKVSDLNTEIASASSEQTSGIQQISKAMNQLDQASQSNAASAEEISATSGEISTLAVDTQNMTIELSEVIHGKNADVTAPVAKDSGPKASKHKAPKYKDASTKESAKPVAKVIPMKKPAAASKATDVIPFDEDDDRAKVGTTDGF